MIKADINSKHMIGCIAFVGVNEDGKRLTRLKVGVVARYQPSEHRHGIEDVVVRMPSGRELVFRQFADGLYIVPKERPAVWAKILEDNASVRGIQNVEVCETYRGTTLFHKRTGDTLFGEISEITTCGIYLSDGGDSPQESKGSLEDSHTTYKVGNVDLDMEAEHYI